MSEKYDVVFSGKMVPGADEQKIKNNAAKVFHASLEQLEKLFSGKPVILKGSLPQSDAETFQSKLKRIGLICDIRTKSQPGTVNPANPQSEPTSTAPQETSEPPPQAPAEKIAQEPETESVSDGAWSLAPAGAVIGTLKSTEPPITPDISQFELASQEGYLVEADDTPPPEPPDTSRFSLEK